MDWRNQQTKFHANNTRGSISVYGDTLIPRSSESHDYPKGNRGDKRNRYYKYLSAVIALFVAAPVNAETVGGVSATASPVANSSGSVTNQAIQVLQGPYITNTYGGGIQCQGPTRNFTPYVTGTLSAARPYEPYYMDPVYDVTDLSGAFDEDGNPIPDGRLDNPGDIIFSKKTRTGQKDNYSLGIGFSMTWSTPTDKKLQELCKQAAASNIQLMQQAHANKRLDFEIARLKNCGELMQKGIFFKPGTEMAKVCADVVVVNKTHIAPHTHSIPSPSASESRESGSAADLGAPLKTQQEKTSP